MPRSADVSGVRPRISAPGRTGNPILGGVFISGQFLALNAVGLFATAYMIRRLGPLQYGQWATAAALAQAHLLLTSAGVRTLFVREVARQPERAEELLGSQLAVRLILAGVASALALLVCLLLGYPSIVMKCTAVWCAWIFISVIGSTLGDVLQSLERFGVYSLAAFAAGVAVTVTAVVAVALGWGPIGLSVAYLASPIVGAVLSWLALRTHVAVRVRWDRGRVKTLMRESRLVGLNHIAAAVRDRAEQLLVPRLVGLAPFGAFSAGTMISDRLSNIPDAICTAFYPRISRGAHGSTDGSPQSAVARMLAIGLAASLPLAIVGMYLSNVLAAILMPAAQEVCRTVIQITVWSLPLTAIQVAMSFALQGAGHYDRAARRGLRATAISAAASIVLTAGLGITGASYAVVARPGIIGLALGPSFRRVFPGVLTDVPIVRILLCSGCLAVVCANGDRQHVWPALIYTAIGGVIYAVALVTSGVLRIASIARYIGPSPAITVGLKS